MKIIDMHCDTISRICQERQRYRKVVETLGNDAPSCTFQERQRYRKVVETLGNDVPSCTFQKRQQETQPALRSNSFQVDLKKMRHSGYLLQNFAIFVDFQETCHPIEDCYEQIRVFQEEMKANQDLISPVTTYGEIIKNQKQGKMSALMTLEEGALCQGSLENLRSFYRIGIRMMTFTWNYPNSLGYPAQSNPYQGLTPLGIEFLEEMESLGIIPDVSHLSDDGIRDVCRFAKKPFCASHSNARSLCPHQRNLPDGLIRGISEHGGIIGANYYGTFLSAVPDSLGRYYSDAAKIAAHIRHISNIGGISCIGLGSDFDGIDENLEMKDCGYMELLEHALRKEGFHESEIDQIFYKNALAFYQEVL